MSVAAGGPQSFVVSAESKAVATITVHHGETWRFTATGRWRDWWIPCGPDGYRNFVADVLDFRPRAADENWFCLIGMLDDDASTMFAIGSAVVKTFEFAQPDAPNPFPEGRVLSVFANDQMTRYANNAGEVTLLAEPSLQIDAPGHAPQSGATGATADFVSWAARGWQQLGQMLRETGGILFVATLVLGVSLVLLLLQQGRDLILSVGEDGFSSAGGRAIWFGVGLWFMAVQGWFWPRMIIESTYGRCRENWKPRWLLEWGPRALAFAPFLLVFFALLQAWSSHFIFVAVELGLGVVLLIYLIMRNDIEQWRKHRSEEKAKRHPGKVISHRPIFGREWAVFGVTLAIVAMGIAIKWHVTPEQALGAPAVVFFGIGLLIPGVVIISQLGGDVRLPLLGGLLALAAVFSLGIDNHAVGRRTTSAAVKMATADQISLKEALTAWKAHAPPKNSRGHYVMTLVAAEGGASRAGFWTGEVLAALRIRYQETFDQSLFAISSVSGGSVGAVGYAAALRETPDPKADLEPRIRQLTGADALSPDAGGLLFTDLAQRFLPVPLFPDRAEFLEEAWEKAWSKNCAESCPVDLAKPFTALWSGLPKNGWLPLVIVNGANEESGGQILTSRLAIDRSDFDAADFYAMNSHQDVPASTAIHNGARFPWISPAGRLKQGGHILDGGYFDTVGTETLRQLARAIHNQPDGADVDFLLITIQYQGRKDAAACKPKSFLNEVMAPFSGIFASRDGHGAHMLVTLQDDIADSKVVLKPNPCLASNGPAAPTVSSSAPPIPGRSVTVTLTDPPDAFEPLDWALSQKAQNWMHCSADLGAASPSKACETAFTKPNREAFNALADLLTPAAAAPASRPVKP